MYYVEESRKGYAIYFKDRFGREYISDALTLKQANKWCKRLNEAFNKGYASDY
ncbi:hypothetical protein WKH56_20195 [Priestia sp. SB1]|uniref:hypothetical protein n=1 Tax=Priestia sp. SB1 TaxID=3132359 RepID=UPI00317E105F